MALAKLKRFYGLCEGRVFITRADAETAIPLLLRERHWVAMALTKAVAEPIREGMKAYHAITVLRRAARSCGRALIPRKLHRRRLGKRFSFYTYYLI